MSRAEISAWRQALQQRWQALAERERVLLWLGGTVLGLALLWWVGLAPAWRTVRAAPQKIEALDLQLQDMQRLAAELQRVPRCAQARQPLRRPLAQAAGPGGQAEREALPAGLHREGELALQAAGLPQLYREAAPMW